jgi:nicotinamide mononucleotide transporter
VSLYEVVGVAFGVVAVWLTVRENIWCWPTGLVNVGLFIIVFYEARLYADMGLQVVYVALCLYGWYAWLHGGRDQGALSVARTPARIMALLGVLGPGVALALGLTLRHHTDASLPFWDSALTSGSLAAQWMQTRKWIENWVVWIAVDTVYVGVYLYKDLYLTAALYAVFLALAVTGLIEWKKALAAARPA